MIVVTGGAGFLGGRIVRVLLASGRSVHVLTRRGGPTQSGLELSKSLTWTSVDIRQPLPADEFRGATAVVHAAAWIPRDTSDPAEAEPCWQTNVLGSMHVHQAVRVAGVPVLIHMSTGNAYSAGLPIAAETDPLYPSARAPYYLTSKVTGDVLADHLGRTSSSRVVILRPSSVFGSGMAPEGVVPLLVNRALAGKPLRLTHGGRYRADFVHVDDVASAVAACIENDVRGPLNLGSGVATSTLDLAQNVLKLTDRPESQIELDHSGAASNDLGFPALDISRARTAIGYKPRSLADGLLEMLRASPA